MDDTFRLLISYFWIWIPIVAILAGSFKEWLKFKEKTAALGSSTVELERVIEQMARDRKTLARRVENLEAIVTHEVWDAARKEPARIDSTLLDMEPSDSDRAEALAKRLRG